jgi:hypothetical protein
LEQAVEDWAHDDLIGIVAVQPNVVLGWSHLLFM